LYLLNRCGIIKDPATKLPKIKVIETRSLISYPLSNRVSICRGKKYLNFAFALRQIRLRINACCTRGEFSDLI
jgi:hypothetical protein